MKHIDLLVERYPSLESEKNSIISAYLLLEECYVNGGKLLVAGNGGSAADAEHIVGELMKGFKMPRKPRADFAEKLMARKSGIRNCSCGKFTRCTSRDCVGWTPSIIYCIYERLRAVALFCTAG